MSAGNHKYRFTREKIAARLKLIGPLVHRRTSPLDPFRFLPLEGVRFDAPICADPSGWDRIPPGGYWGRADLNFVMKSAFAVPVDWDAQSIALHLSLGVLGDIFNHPEAMIYVDQVPIGSADRYHHTLPLGPELADGRQHVLSLHGWTGHAGWPPDPQSTAKLHLGQCSVVEMDRDTLDFVDLAHVALDSLSVIDPDSGPYAQILDGLDDAVTCLDTRDPLGRAFYASVPGALATLRARLSQIDAPHDTTLHAIGHAHMDIAYLWPISQMRLKNARTYTNVLRLMEDTPDFRFSHSQPALYEMTAENYPALFDRIKARVADGCWEPMGGMWVEPDLNLPGPEALVRQLTLGRDYYRAVFGPVDTPVLWLPDSFGFPGQIPQLMKQAGLDWFITNKLNWNQYNRVPWATHIWEGIDGSQVKAHILTTPRDVQYLPFPTNYKSDLTAREVMGTVTHAGAGAATALPICFGYGDGGGGPTDALIAKAKAFADFPGMPRVRFSTVKQALAALQDSAKDWPVWQGEHYLEGHRGVYTSQGWIKRANRRAEQALHEAEAMAAMAGQSPDLTPTWKLLCLNQFHDIITGTSVPEVFVDARKDYARIAEMTEAAAALAAHRLALDQPAVVNTAPTQGDRVVCVDSALPVAGQKTESGTLLYLENLLPYAVTSVANARLPDDSVRLNAQDGCVTLENKVISAVFEQGVLVSVVDKSSQREILAVGDIGNALVAFEDRPIAWDAWDIDPHYEDRESLLGAPSTVEIVEKGPIRASLRVTYEWRRSRIVQDISLIAGSGRLDFDTRVDWHETHILLKAAFPLSFSAPQATFDIQWGTIRRPTDRDTAFSAARFEVPAQKWAELSDDQLSVALMNDCKYGYDVRGNTLRLTLIKSATSPDPQSDQGHHAFCYSLFVNPDNDIGRRNHAAYDLNSPLRVLPARSDRDNATVPTSFASVSAANVIIETIMPARSGTGYVLRLFECAGTATEFALRLRDGHMQVQPVDFFEVPVGQAKNLDPAGRFHLGGFEILNLLVTQSTSPRSEGPLSA